MEIYLFSKLHSHGNHSGYTMPQQHPVAQFLAFVLFLVTIASALVGGYAAGEWHCLICIENLFHFLLITGMKNISFRVSTDNVTAQNIIVQLDHSLGRGTNQKYSYLPFLWWNSLISWNLKNSIVGFGVHILWVS